MCRMFSSKIVFSLEVSVYHQDQIIGVKEFHLAKALLEGEHEEHSQFVNESIWVDGVWLSSLWLY